MARQKEEERRRVRRVIPISSRAAALAEQRDKEQRAALARAKAVEENEQAIQAYASIRLQRQKEACDAHARLVLLCHPVELLPPQCGMIPVVIPSPLPLYKVVSVAKAGGLVSVLDGQERYELDKWTLAKHGAASWPPVYACSSAFATPTEAICEQFPTHSRMLKAPKVLVKLDALGKAYYHEKTRMWALSKARVAALLTQLDPIATLDVHWALNGRDVLTAPLEQRAAPNPAPVLTRPPPHNTAAPAATSPHAIVDVHGAGAAGSSHAHQQHHPQLPDSRQAMSASFPSGEGADDPQPQRLQEQQGKQGQIDQQQQQQQQQQQAGQHRRATLQQAPTSLCPRHHGRPDSAPPSPLSSCPFPSEHNSGPIHSSGARLSAPIRRTSPLPAQPTILLPPRFDSSSFGSNAWRGAVAPNQLVARDRPCSPRRTALPFPPPFDLGTSSRPVSPPRPPYNPAAGGGSCRPVHKPGPHNASLPPPLPHSQAARPPAAAAPAAAPGPPGSRSGSGVGADSSGRGASPPPQPRASHPRPSAAGTLSSAQGPDGLQGPGSTQGPGDRQTLAPWQPRAAPAEPLSAAVEAGDLQGHTRLRAQANTTLQQRAMHLAPLPAQKQSTDHHLNIISSLAGAVDDRPPPLSWTL